MCLRSAHKWIKKSSFTPFCRALRSRVYYDIKKKLCLVVLRVGLRICSVRHTRRWKKKYFVTQTFDMQIKGRIFYFYSLASSLKKCAGMKLCRVGWESVFYGTLKKGRVEFLMRDDEKIVRLCWWNEFVFHERMLVLDDVERFFKSEDSEWNYFVIFA